VEKSKGSPSLAGRVQAVLDVSQGRGGFAWCAGVPSPKGSALAFAPLYTAHIRPFLAGHRKNSTFFIQCENA